MKSRTFYLIYFGSLRLLLSRADARKPTARLQGQRADALAAGAGQMETVGTAGADIFMGRMAPHARRRSQIDRHEGSNGGRLARSRLRTTRLQGVAEAKEIEKAPQSAFLQQSRYHLGGHDVAPGRHFDGDVDNANVGERATVSNGDVWGSTLGNSATVSDGDVWGSTLGNSVTVSNGDVWDSTLGDSVTVKYGDVWHSTLGDSVTVSDGDVWNVKKMGTGVCIGGDVWDTHVGKDASVMGNVGRDCYSQESFFQNGIGGETICKENSPQDTKNSVIESGAVINGDVRWAIVKSGATVKGRAICSTVESGATVNGEQIQDHCFGHFSLSRLPREKCPAPATAPPPSTPPATAPPATAPPTTAPPATTPPATAPPATAPPTTAPPATTPPATAPPATAPASHPGWKDEDELTARPHPGAGPGRAHKRDEGDNERRADKEEKDSTTITPSGNVTNTTVTEADSTARHGKGKHVKVEGATPNEASSCCEDSQPTATRPNRGGAKKKKKNAAVATKKKQGAVLEKRTEDDDANNSDNHDQGCDAKKLIPLLVLGSVALGLCVGLPLIYCLGCAQGCCCCRERKRPTVSENKTEAILGDGGSPLDSEGPIGTAGDVLDPAPATGDGPTVSPSDAGERLAPSPSDGAQTEASSEAASSKKKKKKEKQKASIASASDVSDAGEISKKKKKKKKTPPAP